jgi:hypothetical protein
MIVWILNSVFEFRLSYLLMTLIRVSVTLSVTITHESVLETHEPSYVPRAAKPFFILVVQSSPGAVGHVAAPELPSLEGRTRSRGTRGSTRAPVSGSEAQSHGTHGNTGAHLSKEARSGVTRHMTASEPTPTARWGPELGNTWQRQISPQQWGEVRGHVSHDSAEAHLSKEVRSEVTGHVGTPESTSIRRCGPKLPLT